MEIKNGNLVLPKNYKQKKITATSFYGLAGGNKFKPRGDYLLSVLGLLKEDFDPFYTARGEVAERVLKKYYESHECKIKTWDKFAIHFDMFPKQMNFGGMVDMVITEQKGEPKRGVVECKSKNIKDQQKIMNHPNLEQEYQALFYAYLSKTNDVRITYVFFTDEQEAKIRAGEPIDENWENFTFFEKTLTLDEDDVKTIMEKALLYKIECIRRGMIPLEDISDHALELLGLKEPEKKEDEETVQDTFTLETIIGAMESKSITEDNITNAELSAIYNFLKEYEKILEEKK